MSRETVTISEFGLIGIEGQSNCKGNFLSCEVKPDFYIELEEFAKTEAGSDVFQFASNGKCLRAKSFVGTIQTRSGHQLEIIPKTKNEKEVDSSKEILVKLLHLLYKLPNYKHIESAKFKVDRLIIFEIFIFMFLEEVGVLIKKSIKSDYNQLEDNLKFMKGKLLIKEQIKYNAVHKERFFVQYDEYTPNRAENRLIKSTLLFLLNLSKDFTNQRLIRQHLEHLHLVDRSTNLERDFASIKTGRGLEHYRNALIWCRVFLKKESFSSYSGETIAFAILYPMEKLFEAFVEWYLVKKCSEYKISTQYHLSGFVTDGDNNAVSRSIKPDFVLEKENKLIIADAKWKLLENLGDISQGDLYQLYSHKSYIKKHKSKEDGQKVFNSSSRLFYPKTDYLTESKTLTYFDDEELIICPLDLAEELIFAS